MQGIANSCQPAISSSVKTTTFIVCCACLLVFSRCALTPGGGGSTQNIPESVKAGDSARVKLGLSVWGAGGSIKGRYTDVVAFYRLVGESGYKGPLSPTVLPQDETHEVYEFSFPAYPQGTQGEIEFFFELKLDGQPSRIAAGRKIKIE